MGSDVSLYDRCKLYRESIGAPWFGEPWDLNMLVIRSRRVGVWDDRVIFACVDETGRRIVQRVRATSDAWGGEWTHPTHPDGAVYVLAGHYQGGYELGEHRGRPALRQRRPFRNVRWPPNGLVPSVDELEAIAAAGAVFVDNRGTHWHNRRNGQAPETPAPGDSEGCIVSLWQHQHAAGIELVRRQLAVHGSGIVSPTFLRWRDIPA